ncbi:hypothetical protein B0H11DRAFT_282532 [Mycena galericulata]|nr:hypothetical protein B0H11DRAFT_282532 [Mycena galericulata]
MPLPIELAECIIDASCYHPPTLATCSLVCKQWLPRSRHLLFSSLDLSADWNPEPNSVTEFIKIIDSPNSTVIPYIRTVVLSKRSWGMTPVQKILTVLARSGARPGFLHINCPTYEPTHFPIFSVSLAHLTLYLHNDMPMATLIDHICAFPLLESLYIGGSAQFFHGGLFPTARELPPKFHTLIICDPVFAHWVLSLDPPPTQISTIVLRHIRLPDQWAAVNRYLGSPCAAGIRSLTFQGCDTSTQLPPDMHRMDDLQELIIECSAPGSAPAATSLLHVLAALRAAPACTALETLDLFVVSPLALSIMHPESQWREADSLLADPRLFLRLRRIRIRVRVRSAKHPESDFPVDYPMPGPLAALLEREMPGCTRRSILSVR